MSTQTNGRPITDNNKVIKKKSIKANTQDVTVSKPWQRFCGGRGHGGRSGGHGNHSHKSTNMNKKTSTKDQVVKQSTKLDNPANHYKSGTGTANLANTMEIHEVIMSHIQKTFVEGYNVAWALKFCMSTKHNIHGQFAIENSVVPFSTRVL